MDAPEGENVKVVVNNDAASKYSLADQQARFARAQQEGNMRYLDIATVYDSRAYKNKRVAVTGANRGLGLELCQQLVQADAQIVALVRQSSPELDALKSTKIITGVDVTDDKICDFIAKQLKDAGGGPVDILINNAGYFYEPEETLKTMNFEEQMKQINICAIGLLRVSSAFLNANLIKEKTGKIIMITSQGGSVSWRTTQNPKGHDYGHHMSKAAANMGSVLLAQEIKDKGIAVGIFHPGFNRTKMTEKYKHIWDVEGAVDPECGAMRVLYETARLCMDTTGKFINCEDGLEIPF